MGQPCGQPAPGEGVHLWGTGHEAGTVAIHAELSANRPRLSTVDGVSSPREDSVDDYPVKGNKTGIGAPPLRLMDFKLLFYIYNFLRPVELANVFR